jgi:sodium transport system permease protein
VQTRKVVTIFRKELIDTLRDRRTLIFMLLVPLVAIPGLMTVASKLMMGQMTKAMEERSKVVVEGAQYLPDDLRDSLFAAQRLDVIDASTYKGNTDNFKDEVRSGSISAYLVIPEAFDRAIEFESPTDVEIYYDEAEVSSGFAVDKINDILNPYKNSIVAGRLRSRDISTDILMPFAVKELNVASARKVAGKMMGGILPYIVILMCFMGAMYPAIDLAAGEKERGTLETLLVSPASRGEFVVGKYLVILTTAVVAALLALASLTFSLNYIVGDFPAKAMEKLAISFDFNTVLLILMIVIPLAGIFAAVLLSVSIFAKSFKEAQSYIGGLNMLIILPAFVSILPGIEINFTVALIPVVNISLIIKEAISGSIEWKYVFTAFFSTVALAGITLYLAKEWFKRESVLFRT